jgi:hypothetical protein
MRNALNWFEIPVTDMGRAMKFYGDVLDITFTPGPGMGNGEMAMFPDEGGVGGALLRSEGWTPGVTGSVIYLNCGNDLDAPLGRVEAAGGKVVWPKTDIGENGTFAFILDTEGNRIGLHSNK